MKKAFLFNYPSKNCDIFKQIKPVDIIIAVDGGIDFLKQNNIVPDLWIGDFDSIKEKPQNYSAKKIIKFNPEKDFSDTELAIDWAYKNNIKKIVIVNSISGRFDHSYGQICNLIFAKNLGLQASIYAGTHKAKILSNYYTSFAKKNKIISLFSLSSQTTGLTIKNLKYETNNTILKKGSCLGISNVGLGKEFSICFKSGTLLIIKEL